MSGVQQLLSSLAATDHASLQQGDSSGYPGDI